MRHRLLFLEATHAMAADGIRAITSSCGFNGIFQARLTESSPVAVLTSALLQLPWLERLIAPERNIGVITANQVALSDAHFEACGLDSLDRLRIAGIEHTVGQRPTTPPRDMLTGTEADTLNSSGDPLWANMNAAQAGADSQNAASQPGDGGRDDRKLTVMPKNAGMSIAAVLITAKTTNGSKN